MKLLIFTQVVDLEDSALSFFHRWLIEFSKHFDQIIVICLKEGRHSLPVNIKVLSLGKESGRFRLKYIWRFYLYLWRLRGQYDRVFVHMNQEYVILGGLIWKALGIPTYLWRNYHSGNFLTFLAVKLCRRVCFTSASSYTAKFPNAVMMPVGIDLELFSNQPHIKREPNTILSLGRITPDKRLEIFIGALVGLSKNNNHFKARMYGDPWLEKYPDYPVKLKNLASFGGLNSLEFYSGVSNMDTPSIYSAHDIFVNSSPSGMYDKTIFEAAGCGCLVLASSADWGESVPAELFFDGSAEDLKIKLLNIMSMTSQQKESLTKICYQLAKKQSLDELGSRLRTLLY